MDPERRKYSLALSPIGGSRARVRIRGVAFLSFALMVSGCATPQEGPPSGSPNDPFGPAPQSRAGEFVLRPSRLNASAILFNVTNLPPGGLGEPTFRLHREIAEAPPGAFGALIVFEISDGVARLYSAEPFDSAGSIGGSFGPVGSASTSMLVVALSDTEEEREIMLRPSNLEGARLVATGLSSGLAIYGNLFGLRKGVAHGVIETDGREEIAAGAQSGTLAIETAERTPAGAWLTLVCSRASPSGVALTRTSIAHDAGVERFDGHIAGAARAGDASWAYLLAELSGPIGASFEIEGAAVTKDDIGFLALHVAPPDEGWPFAFEREDSRDPLAEPARPGC